MIKRLGILIFLIFGVLYSVYLSLYIGFFPSFVFILITTGIGSTIYILDKKINYRIIVYIWIALITVAVVALLIEWVFKISILLKNPQNFK